MTSVGVSRLHAEHGTACNAFCSAAAAAALGLAEMMELADPLVTVWKNEVDRGYAVNSGESAEDKLRTVIIGHAWSTRATGQEDEAVHHDNEQHSQTHDLSEGVRDANFSNIIAISLSKTMFPG